MSTVRIVRIDYTDTPETQGVASSSVRVTCHLQVDTMEQALEFTRNVQAVAALGVVSGLALPDLTPEESAEHMNACKLYVDEDGHAMTIGRFDYLLKCAEERGRDTFRRRSAGATKGATKRKKPVGAKPRKRAR